MSNFSKFMDFKYLNKEQQIKSLVIYLFQLDAKRKNGFFTIGDQLLQILVSQLLTRPTFASTLSAAFQILLLKEKKYVNDIQKNEDWLSNFQCLSYSYFLFLFSNTDIYKKNVYQVWLSCQFFQQMLCDLVSFPVFHLLCAPKNIRKKKTISFL